MTLIDFLEKEIEGVLREIEGRGDNQDELYGKIVRFDAEEYEKSTAALCVKGTGSEKVHSLWVRLWSRDESEIEGIEELIKSAPEFKEAGNRTYICGPVVLSLKKENEKREKIAGLEVQIVYNQSEPFTKQDYHDNVKASLYWLRDRLKGEEQPRQQSRPKSKTASFEISETEQPAAAVEVSASYEGSSASDVGEEYDDPNNLDVKELYETKSPKKITIGMVHDGNIIIEDVEGVKQIRVEIEGKELGGRELGDSVYVVMPSPDNGTYVKRNFSSKLPTESQKMDVVRYAGKVADILVKS
ncbi:hypothetical protein KY361_05845 [Candidatus Woesearchaeota archaeon]|nr:hypothetical protein [Candidatus Woesearchaeota archaeon]